MKPRDLRLDELENLVLQNRVGHILSFIDSSLPFTTLDGVRGACPEFAKALALAYKDSGVDPHPEVLHAWVSRVASEANGEPLHTRLCRLILPVLLRTAPSGTFLRMLLDTLEGHVSKFCNRPVDEPSLQAVELGVAALQRRWTPGQARRTLLGIVADLGVASRPLWEVLLPPEFSAMPLATARMGILEYLPHEPRYADVKVLIRERFKPGASDLEAMGKKALRRLARDGLPFVATERRKDDVHGYQPARSSATGALVLLDAGAPVPDGEWPRLARLQVRTANDRFHVSLFHALLAQVRSQRNLERLGGPTLVRMIESGAVDVNAPLHDNGTTPLHVAASGQNAELVALLIHHGADPRVADATGTLPRDLAVKWKHKPVVLLLDACLARHAMTDVIRRRPRSRANQ